MTVSTNTSQITYSGNGVTTTFSYPNRFFTVSDIKVYVGGILLTTGFSVVGTAASGSGGFQSGNIVFSVAPASGTNNILIICDPDLLQSTDIPANGPFPAGSVEDMSDKLTVIAQRNSGKLTRALRIGDGDSPTTLSELPLLSARANNLLSFDANGQPIAVIPAAQSATALQTLLAASTGSSLVGTIQAGIGAVARTVQDKERDIVSVFDFMTSAQIADVRARTYLIDVTAAVQAAVNASVNKSLYLPSGGYKMTAQITMPDANMTIYGDGMGVTILRWTTVVIQAFLGNYAAITTKVNFYDFSMEAGVVAAGIAFKLTWVTTASWNSPTLTMQNIEIAPSDYPSQYWTEGVIATYAWGAEFDNIRIRGKNNTLAMSTGIHLVGRSNEISINDCHFYFTGVGVQCDDLVEGTIVEAATMVYVGYGVYAVGLTADSPDLTVSNSHISALSGCIINTKKTQGHIYNNTLYKRAESTANFPFIQCLTSDNMNIHHNTCIVQGGATGTAVGVSMQTCGYAQVNFNTTQGADTCVEFTPASSNYTAIGNRRLGGTLTMYANGTAGANILRDNLPADSSGYQTFAVNAATPSVQNSATGSWQTANSVATTITNFLDGYAGQVINILCNDVNTTIQHNVNITLQGGVNFVAGSGAILSLKRDTVWREISRRTA